MNSSLDKTDHVFKILTIGESGVGKTCLLIRYTENKFQKNYLTTIGIDFKSKNIMLKGKSVKLKIWDTAGQERFRNITQQYYKGADGIVLVFDVTDSTTFEKISDWMKQISAFTQPDKIGIVLLGNKIDMEPRQVKHEQGVEIAKKYGVQYFETSAHTNYNVEESFQHLAEEIMKKKGIDVNDAPVTQTPTKNIELTKESIKDSKGKKKGCC
jgi:small GTP-binding protein